MDFIRRVHSDTVGVSEADVLTIEPPELCLNSRQNVTELGRLHGKLCSLQQYSKTFSVRIQNHFIQKLHVASSLYCKLFITCIATCNFRLHLSFTKSKFHNDTVYFGGLLWFQSHSCGILCFCFNDVRPPLS